MPIIIFRQWCIYYYIRENYDKIPVFLGIIDERYLPNLIVKLEPIIMYWKIDLSNQYNINNNIRSSSVYNICWRSYIVRIKDISVHCIRNYITVEMNCYQLMDLIYLCTVQHHLKVSTPFKYFIKNAIYTAVYLQVSSRHYGDFSVVYLLVIVVKYLLTKYLICIYTFL